MLFEIITAAVIAALIGLYVYETVRLEKRVNHAFDQNAKMVALLIELEKKIDSIDQSTGADVHQLRTEFNMFKADYGDAAIEEMRQAAKREKAWADGISEIMSYGARYQGRGDTE